MNIPLCEPNIGIADWPYVKQSLASGWVSSAGKFVGEFEDAVCRYTQAKHAVACINGTSGLFIGLKVCGVGPGDEVIVPTLTFIAPVNAVRYLGAEPVFMDCDDYLNLDPQKLRDFCRNECVLTRRGLRNKKTARLIKAVVPVHIFGNPCDMPAIRAIARQYRLRIVEDATESLGSRYTTGELKGKFTGTIGDIGVFSFNGNKIITAGNGGMIVTNRPRYARLAQYLVNQAKDDPVRYLHYNVGYNFRLSSLNAALGLAQLKRIEEFIRIKRKNYAVYSDRLSALPGVAILPVPEYARCNCWFYSLQVKAAEFGMSSGMVLKEFLKRGIQARPVWQLNHVQRPYRKNPAYKITKAWSFLRTVVNIPCSTNLKISQIDCVVAVLRNLAS